jgi:hypothetical protein
MILMRRVGHAGHAVHLFRGGVEWLCVIVVLLLLRRGCVVHGFGLDFGCFWFGLGRRSCRLGSLWLDVFSIVP